MQHENYSSLDAATHPKKASQTPSPESGSKYDWLVWVADDMRFCTIILAVIAIIALAVYVWLNRYSEHTANGRYYRTDRYTFKTLVIEKDGTQHQL